MELEMVKPFEKAAEAERKNVSFAMVAIAGYSGSVSRKNAIMMVDLTGNFYGTIGGGELEAFGVKIALECLKKGQGKLVKFVNEQGNNPLSGGEVLLNVTVCQKQKILILVGGGHVNQEIGKLASHIGYEVQVVENREEYSRPELFPYASKIVCKPCILEGLKELEINEHTQVVVSSYAIGDDGIKYLVDSKATYLGILGSRNKTRDFKQRFNFSKVESEKVFAPVGLDLGGQTPEEIALATVSEMMKVFNGRPGTSLKEKMNKTVVVKGGGDIATGTIIRLAKSGFQVVVTECDKPTIVRRSVSFAQCVYEGEMTIEGLTAVYIKNIKEINETLDNGKIPVIVDPEAKIVNYLNPTFVIDAILAKKNLGTKIDDAPFVIGLGPGFEAGKDVDVVIETCRGHFLGSLIYKGKPLPNSNLPGNIDGYTIERVLRAPISGTFTTKHNIGDLVEKGDVVCEVDGNPVFAKISGMIRGLLNEGLKVTPGFKIGDIDPRGSKADYHTSSDKAKAVAGGVLEAVITFLSKRK